MTSNLESILSGLGDSPADLVTWLRNQQVGPNAYPGVPAE